MNVSVRLLCVVALGAAVSCAEPAETSTSEQDYTQRRDFAWFEARGAEVLADSENRILLGTDDFFVTRTGLDGAPLYTFPLSTQQTYVRDELLNKPGVEIGYVARTKLSEFADGFDLSWQAGWPTGDIDVSGDVNIDGAGYVKLGGTVVQRYRGGRLHVHVRGPALDRLQVTIEGPLMTEPATSYPLKVGYVVNDSFGFRLAKGQQIEVYAYRIDLPRVGASDGTGFHFGWSDFVPCAERQPARAHLH